MKEKESTGGKRQTWLCKANNEALEIIKTKSSEAKREVICRLEEFEEAYNAVALSTLTCWLYIRPLTCVSSERELPRQMLNSEG